MGGIYPVSQLKAQPTAVGKARQRELQLLGTGHVHPQSEHKRTLAGARSASPFPTVQDPLPTSSLAHNLRWPFPQQLHAQDNLPQACLEAHLPDDSSFCQVDN